MTPDPIIPKEEEKKVEAKPANAFRIKRGLIIGLASWLNELSLVGRSSRERSRFVSILSTEIAQVEKERKEIVVRYAKLDKEGKPKTTVDNGVERYDIPNKELNKLDEEYQELMSEDFVLDIGEEHKAKMRAIKDILLETDYKFGPKQDDSVEEKTAKIRQANDYQLWCESVESLDL